jgi:hypothetical protein
VNLCAGARGANAAPQKRHFTARMTYRPSLRIPHRRASRARSGRKRPGSRRMSRKRSFSLAYRSSKPAGVVGCCYGGRWSSSARGRGHFVRPEDYYLPRPRSLPARDGHVGARCAALASTRGDPTAVCVRWRPPTDATAVPGAHRGRGAMVTNFDGSLGQLAQRGMESRGGSE